MFGAILKITQWATKFRPDDPNVLENLHDLSDILDAIRQSMGW
ncbi:hypothetical protein ACOJUR_11930 [Alicyclobacillus tolerans]